LLSLAITVIILRTC